jgi:adenine-specific DNA-methyltransferase
MSVVLLRKPKQVKQDGATFTPTALANYLASELLGHVPASRPIRVLDPACGDGALLYAMGAALDAAGIPHTLSGYDINRPYLDLAEELLSGLGALDIALECGDFLESFVRRKSSPGLFETADQEVPAYDLVIANPPYVRTQHLGAERAQMIAEKFELKGRVDLYYPFVMAMTRMLKSGGMLGLITSNRFLSIQSGAPVRQFLSAHYDVKHIVDLGDTKLFDASVLPALLIAKRSEAMGKHQVDSAAFTRVYGDSSEQEQPMPTFPSVIDALRMATNTYFRVGASSYRMTNGTLLLDQSDKPWGLLADDEDEWVQRVNAGSSFMLGERFKVRVGIKTTADKVFIRSDWGVLNGTQPEPELLRDLISQENIGAWRIKKAETLKILYTHEIRNGKRKPIDFARWPKAEAYLLANEEVLKARKYVSDAGRAWYEIWVPQDPASWKLPKLVFPDISETPRFYFDTSGKLVNGNCYWIPAASAEQERLLMLAQAVCNSTLMRRYHDLVFQNKLYAGRRRYFTQFIEKYPMPDPDSPISEEIIQTVRQIHASGSAAESHQLEARINVLVNEAFGMA